MGGHGKTTRGTRVNCTHSGSRWAVRTLVPFQTVSPLQERIKQRLQKTNTSTGAAHFLLCSGRLRSAGLSGRQRTTRRPLSGGWEAVEESRYLLQLLQTSVTLEMRSVRQQGSTGASEIRSGCFSHTPVCLVAKVVVIAEPPPFVKSEIGQI